MMGFNVMSSTLKLEIMKIPHQHWDFIAKQKMDLLVIKIMDQTVFLILDIIAPQMME
jgi:hypothetical protein